MVTDAGYLGLKKLHNNTRMPTKRSKNKYLDATTKSVRRALARERVGNEHVIGMIKRFKTVSDEYRNRRKRFGLRVNLIAGVCIVSYKLCFRIGLLMRSISSNDPVFATYFRIRRDYGRQVVASCGQRFVLSDGAFIPANLLRYLEQVSYLPTTHRGI